MLDIYFEAAYGKLCELVDEGPSCRYVLSTENGLIVNQFIKRAVPFLIDGMQYYDIVTPYGYGGPIVVKSNNKERLIVEYLDQFANYCADNNIICEFIRYHPIFKNYLDFINVYENTFSRHTVGTNLRDYDDPVQDEFSKSARKEVRKAEKAGVECVLNLHPRDLSTFRVLYEETMDRNHAGRMYYFPDMYYEMLTSEIGDSLLEIQAYWEGKVIASEIYFVSNGLMHAHLLGSDRKLLEIGGGAILEASAARWGKENGYSFIHHGGGRSSATDDPLFLYKKKFGKHTEFDFYTGKKIWNPAVYGRALEIRRQEKDINNLSYFPAYRG